MTLFCEVRRIEEKKEICILSRRDMVTKEHKLIYRIGHYEYTSIRALRV